MRRQRKRVRGDDGDEVTLEADEESDEETDEAPDSANDVEPKGEE